MEPAYQPLLGGEDQNAENEHSKIRRHAPPISSVDRWYRRNIQVPLLILIPVFIIQITLVYILVRSSFQQGRSYHNPSALYSPAQEAVEYETVKFHSGLHNETDIYSGPPSAAVDDAWQDLYRFGISKVSEEEANKLANATVKVTHLGSEYIVLLDVFHQLHCLNKIRMALHPEYYTLDPKEASTQGLHLSHCLGMLRQSVQCSSDISTIVWDKGGLGQEPRFDVLHTCRNFDKIREWAKERQADITG